jgi:hypothetical protein
MTILPLGAELFHADGRTDITKLILAFRNIANARKKKREKVIVWYYRRNRTFGDAVMSLTEQVQDWMWQRVTVGNKTDFCKQLTPLPKNTSTCEQNRSLVQLVHSVALILYLQHVYTGYISLERL